MKYLKIVFAFIVSSCGLIACSGNNSTSTGKGTDATASGTSPGSASFSVMIDGVPVSGNQIDELQLLNTAFIYPAETDKPKRLLFYLSSNKKDKDFYSFRFSFPDSEGQYKFTRENHQKLNCFLQLDFNLKSEDNFSRYNQDSVTVNISKITATRVTGTFSGQLTLSDDTRSKPYKKKVIIADGKFDIPFSTGNLRPE